MSTKKAYKKEGSVPANYTEAYSHEDFYAFCKCAINEKKHTTCCIMLSGM